MLFKCSMCDELTHVKDKRLVWCKSREVCESCFMGYDWDETCEDCFEADMDEEQSRPAFFKPPYKPEADWPGGWITVS